jgi:carboxypeptidase C (cathepsin A)
VSPSHRTLAVTALMLVIAHSPAWAQPAPATVPSLEPQATQPSPPGPAMPPASPPIGDRPGGGQPAVKGAAAEPRTPTGLSAAARQALPADATSMHTLQLPGRTVSFKATAGIITLENAAGMPDAEVGYIAFTLPGRDARTRPVTFAINGGPGSASAWLNVGALGPWRLPMERADLVPSAIPEIVPNAETWLDFTDLVFLDPVGTGYSRLIPAGLKSVAASRPPGSTGYNRYRPGRGIPDR